MASHGVVRAAGPSVRTEETRRREQQQIAAYRELVELVNMKVAERQYTVEVLALTNKLLTENPEYYTVWNHRRRILEHLFSISPGVLSDHPADDPVEQLVSRDIELTFSLLRQFPKCYWIWNHRNWILQQGEHLLGTTAARKLWMMELQLVSKMLHSDNRNFHAWTYRRDVVSQLERIPRPPDAPETPSLTESEFAYTTKMISTNLSNFSAWHNRSKLIPRLLDERQADHVARRKLLDDELRLICSAINTDPFDQSIWYYHQFLMSTISPHCPRQQQIALDLLNSDRIQYYKHEMDYIQEILEDEKDCKWIYEVLLELACSLADVGDGSSDITATEMRNWLEALQRLDPLRKGRWNDMRERLKL